MFSSVVAPLLADLAVDAAAVAGAVLFSWVSVKVHALLKRAL